MAMSLSVTQMPGRSGTPTSAYVTYGNADARKERHPDLGREDAARRVREHHCSGSIIGGGGSGPGAPRTAVGALLAGGGRSGRWD